MSGSAGGPRADPLHAGVARAVRPRRRRRAHAWTITSVLMPAAPGTRPIVPLIDPGASGARSPRSRGGGGLLGYVADRQCGCTSLIPPWRRSRFPGSLHPPALEIPSSSRTVRVRGPGPGYAESTVGGATAGGYRLACVCSAAVGTRTSHRPRTTSTSLRARCRWPGDTAAASGWRAGFRDTGVVVMERGQRRRERDHRRERDRCGTPSGRHAERSQDSQHQQADQTRRRRRVDHV